MQPTGGKVATVDFLRQFVIGVAAVWRRLTVSARISLALWGLAVVAVIALVVFVGSRPQYVTLSDRVDTAVAAEIRTLLADQRIPFELADNNRRVLVPLEHLSDAQLLLAQHSLPVGHSTAPGFKLFDQADLMTNRYLQDIQFMRALQGELEQVLNNFDFVVFSRVIIREAREELFRRDERPAEALVTLQTNRRLTSEEVKGIRSLIAQGGGPNLSVENITIMTTSGEVLASPPDSKFASVANSKREYVVALEREREQRVMQSLREMGVRATVRVSAQVDFDESEITEELAEEGPEISTYTTSTTVTTSERLPEGAPGTLANIAGDTLESGVVHSEESSESITNLEPSYTRTTTRRGPGDVIKYMVALVVEGDYEEVADPQGGQAQRSYTGLSEDRRKTYMDLARMAVGEGKVQTEVILHDHPFEVDMLSASSAALAEISSERSRQVWTGRLWLAGQVLLLLLGFLLLRVFLRRAVEAPEEEEDEESFMEEPKLSPEERRRQMVNDEISRMSHDEPELVTTLLRSWLTEEED